MKKEQRAKAFLKEHKDIFDDEVLPAELIEAVSSDLSNLRSRYSALPESLKVPATLAHIWASTELIIGKLERLRLEMEKMRTTSRASRPESPTDRLYRRV